MSCRIDQWRLLRTKADETTGDTNWAGQNDVPDESICASLQSGHTVRGMPVTGIEVVVVAITAATRVPVDRASGTVDLSLVEVIPRDVLALGGTPGDDELVCDTATVAGVALNRKVYFELNGAHLFTIRVTNGAALPAGTNDLQIWWRGVSR